MVDSVTSPDNYDNMCPICYDEFTPPIVTPDVCKHRYCYKCLKPWFNIDNCCPLDRKNFSQMILENVKKHIRCWSPGDRLRIRAFRNKLDEPDVSPITDDHENVAQSENCDLVFATETTEEKLMVLACRMAGFVEKSTWINPENFSEGELIGIVEVLSEDMHVVPFLDLIFARISREPAETTDRFEEINRKRRDFLGRLLCRCIRLGKHFIDILEDAFPSAMHERLLYALGSYSWDFDETSIWNREN